MAKGYGADAWSGGKGKAQSTAKDWYQDGSVATFGIDEDCFCVEPATKANQKAYNKMGAASNNNTNRGLPGGNNQSTKRFVKNGK